MSFPHMHTVRAHGVVGAIWRDVGLISGDVAVSWVLGACSLTCMVTVVRGLAAVLLEHPAIKGWV